MQTVLIVDDSETFRTQLKQLLDTLGFRVVAEGKDGLEAIDLYVRYRPELVTLDQVMPRLDGLSALREIKKFNPEANVVIISSCISQKTQKEAEELGVSVLIRKPVDLAKLRLALNQLDGPQKGMTHG